MVTKLRRVDSIDAAVALVRASPQALLPLVAGPGVSLPSGRARAGDVTVESYRPGEVHLSVRSPSSAFLLVRESWNEGWRAIVDGAPAAVHPAAGLFFAVAIPRGNHVVELHFDAPGFGAGLALGALWLALAAAAAVRVRTLGADT